ncbi:hypothetical protein AB7C87_24105 [Natrarchaeobius sp. A-rgal3]|uniref:hypothetical protein n=1 Tax=Natrarchaeobius versutus TaxID=1679078 RepID=UPI00350FFF49
MFWKRLTSVIFVLLLVTSLGTPAVTGTAAADTGADCMYDSVDWFIFTCEDDRNYETIDLEDDAAGMEVDIHTGLTGVGASSESTTTIIDNYGEDTATIASLESRNTIAEAYEDNVDAAVADTQAQAAINDYYAQKQINLLNDASVHGEQIAYYANASINHEETENDFVHFAGEADEIRPTGETEEVEVTLANASTHNVTVPRVYFNHGSRSSERVTVNFFEKEYDNETAQTFNQRLQDPSSTASSTYDWGPSVHVLNTGSLESDQKYDYRPVREQFEALEEQSDRVVANYEDGTAQDFYAAMDRGDLEPEDLRGAEGMVRYMSGDANTTELAHQYALRSLLDMDRSGLDTTVVAHFEGYTEEKRNVSDDGSVEYELAGYVDETYEGMLFASDTPEDGFEVNETYDVEDLDGVPVMTVSDGGEAEDIRMIEGELTIEEMYDGDGNEIEQDDWDRPSYDTFDPDEFIEAIEEADQERTIIIEQANENSSDGLDWSNIGGAEWPEVDGSDLATISVIVILALLVLTALAAIVVKLHPANLLK